MRIDRNDCIIEFDIEPDGSVSILGQSDNEHVAPYAELTREELIKLVAFLQKHLNNGNTTDKNGNANG